MHEEETLRKLLKTGRNSANKETPLHANKAVKVLLPVFSANYKYLYEAGVSETCHHKNFDAGCSHCVS